MKKILSLVLALLLLAVMLPTTALADDVIATQEQLATAIAEGKTNIKLGEGEFSLYNVNKAKTQNATLVITGSGPNTIFKIGKMPATETGEYNGDYSYENSNVTFKNLSLNVGTGDYKGIIRASSLNFENCTIDGRGSYWGVGPVVFKDCKFNSVDGDYNIWLYSGSSFTFDNCKFESSAGKFINAYKEQKVDSGLSFTDCDFNYTGNGTPSKPAVCLKSYQGVVWDTTFESCTSNAATDGGTNSNLYSIENGMAVDTSVKINNTIVWSDGAKQNDPPAPPTDGPSTIVIITPSADTPKTDDQKNPSTGANDVVAAAAALMAVAALGMSILSRKK